MAARTLALCCALTLLLAAGACGGKAKAPEATPTATAVPSTTPPPIATYSGSIPPRPAAIEDYPAAIAGYLNEVGAAALGPPCLTDLLTAWQMPAGQYLPPGTSTGLYRCVLGNTDADSEYEVIVSMSAREKEYAPIYAQIVVFDHISSGYNVVYQSPPNGKSVDVPFAILAAVDLTADGPGDLAFAQIQCGAHTCTWNVHVVTGTDTTYRELTPQDGLSLATADVRIEDRDGNGTKEIILHGGIIQSVGAGPQRAQTDLYAWDGQQYTLKSSAKASSDIRLFKVQDADTAFAAGNYQEAVHLYQQAVSDMSLQEVGGFGSRDELMAYALFRLGLSYLKLGDTNAASRQIEAAIGNYPVSLDGRAALAFRNALNLTQVSAGDLPAGCQAAIAYANQNLDRFREAWNYGYANPGFDPAKFCPF